MASTAPFFHPGNPTDELLLTAALSGDQSAWMPLTKRFQPYLATVVRRRAGDLPADLQEEIITEVWAAVFFRGPSSFNRMVSSARDHIASFVKDATDRLRAAYRAPGERSRARDAWRARSRARARPDLTEPAVVSFDQLPERDQPDDPRQEDELRRLDASIYVERAQTLAMPAVALAIDLVRYWGVSYAEAALTVGITRVMLLRQLARLGRRLRAA